MEPSRLAAGSLGGVAETLLIPLFYRAQEAQRPDALVRDASAVDLVQRLNYDFSRVNLQHHDQVGILLRLRQFDRFTRDFLARSPGAVVVHIGCGLDTRFDRVDDGQVEWYDLDLPEVISIRRRLISDSGHCHAIAASVFDPTWHEVVAANRLRPLLFLAEGVLPYFEEPRVKELVLTLLQRFPGAELVCDAVSPLGVRMHNLQLAFTGFTARLHWSLKRGADLETWSDGIRLLEQWYYFDQPEPRFGAAQWMRHITPLARSTGIFHYRLGARPE